jgi:hypothetical protein
VSAPGYADTVQGIRILGVGKMSALAVADGLKKNAAVFRTAAPFQLMMMPVMAVSPPVIVAMAVPVAIEREAEAR